MRSVVCLALVLAACNRDAASPRGSEPHPSAAPSSAPSAAPSGLTRKTPPLGDGCFSEVDLDADQAALHAALARACAPATRPLIDASEHVLGREFEIGFELARAGCVRVIATAPRGSHEIELELVDAESRVVARDTLPARFALIGERGPICLAAGRHRVRGKSAGGAGKLRVEVLVPIADAG